jgi:hypothetical protein
MTMKVRTCRYAIGEYAIIETDTREMSVALDDGMPAKASLHQTANEMRAKAARLVEQAELIERAGAML